MQVTVIDYGIGNLFSVGRALERCGADVLLSSDPSQIESARSLVLPGVGAFADGMNGLRERGLIEPIRRYAASDRPLLAICLGMPMLASVSEEFGTHDGLGLIEGRVVPVPDRTTDGASQKIPHIGWSPIFPVTEGGWDGTPLAAVAPGTSVYLVHSFHVVPRHVSSLLAICRYGGHDITAAIRSGRITGCQFHPEKSGEVGLAVLRNFLAQ
jgi:glutamine amidotransferase